MTIWINDNKIENHSQIFYITFGIKVTTPRFKYNFHALVGMSVRMGWEVISMQTGR